MKGVVFTEFLELAEERLGLATVDRILHDLKLASGASYTSVGTYDHRELVAIASAVSAEMEQPLPDLLQEFGRHLFGRFVVGFPDFFEGQTDSIEFLESVEEFIHVEVRKLYPDAELPRFEHVRDGAHLDFRYRSPRPFAPFALGLIQGCIEHFGQPYDVEAFDVADSDETQVLFRIA